MSTVVHTREVFDIETFKPVPWIGGDPTCHLKGVEISGTGHGGGIYVVIPDGRDQSCCQGDLFIGPSNIVWQRLRIVTWTTEEDT